MNNKPTIRPFYRDYIRDVMSENARMINSLTHAHNRSEDETALLKAAKDYQLLLEKLLLEKTDFVQIKK